MVHILWFTFYGSRHYQAHTFPVKGRENRRKLVIIFCLTLIILMKKDSPFLSPSSPLPRLKTGTGRPRI
jgi:hypothetical protein